MAKPSDGRFFGQRRYIRDGAGKYTWAKCLKCDRGRWTQCVKVVRGVVTSCHGCKACVAAGRVPSKYKPYERRVNGHGYVEIYVPASDPYCPKTRGRSAAGAMSLEHRYVKAKELGRHLATWESVHHRNGVRSDNSPDNLEIWASPHPAGQRPADLVRLYLGELDSLVVKTLLTESKHSYLLRS